MPINGAASFLDIVIFIYFLDCHRKTEHLEETEYHSPATSKQITTPTEDSVFGFKKRFMGVVALYND